MEKALSTIPIGGICTRVQWTTIPLECRPRLRNLARPSPNSLGRRRARRGYALLRGTVNSMGIKAIDTAAITVEEARLARAAAAGDGGAFATLYERYEQRAFNLAYRMVGSEADAADAVKEA